MKKEEITVIEQSIQGVRRLIVEQKQRIMELNDESDVIVKRVNTRREKLRGIFAEVRLILAQQNQLYDQLESIEEKILETKDRISDCHQHYLEIEMDIEISDKLIKKCISVLQNVVTNSSNNSENKKTLIVNNNNNNEVNNNNNNINGRSDNILLIKVNIILFFLLQKAGASLRVHLN